MNIALCEDNPTQARLIGRMVGAWGARRGVAVVFAAYENAEAFLFQLPDREPPDVLLLDIHMGTMSGMELARALRAEGSAVPIVFLTALREHVFEGYDVGALHYLLKPIREEALHACLDRVTEAMTREPESVLILDSRKIRQRDIRYMESDSHYVDIHLPGETVRVKHNLAAMAEKLDGRMFMQCHRCCVVNVRAVERITRTELLLEGGERIPVSRSRWRDINRAFIAYHAGEDLP